VDSGAGDGPGGRPDGLPSGAGWIADPSQLPPGWTVDPQSGELSPPGAQGGLGDPQVHSPQGQAVLDGPGPGEVTTLPAAGDVPGAASEVSMRLGDRTIAFADAGGSGAAVGVTLTGADGASARYEITIDESGNPQLVPATTVPAADGFASGSVAGGAGSSFATGEVGGGPGGSGVSGALGSEVSGEVSTGDSGHATASGHMASGWVSFMDDPAAAPDQPSDEPAEGSARLASVSMASDSGTVSGPGDAQLASVEETRAAQQGGGGGGAPFMPMGGAAGGGGGDQERHGGLWQVPGADDVFEADDEPVAARGVLGDNR
jgi:hypothetical protein